MKKERLAAWIWKRLPAKLRYWCALHVACEVTTGRYADTDPHSVHLMEMLGRMEVAG